MPVLLIETNRGGEWQTRQNNGYLTKSSLYRQPGNLLFIARGHQLLSFFYQKPI